MIISDEHRFLFVHVQKTGGVSFEHVIRPHLTDARSLEGLTRHAPLDKILAAEPGLASYWTVGIVRNPWARMASWWRMVERFRVIAAGGGEKAQRFLSGGGFLGRVHREYADFEAFVLRGTQEWDRLKTPQLGYLTAPGRRADFIGRQEQYDADVRAILVHLGLPEPETVPRDNAGHASTYQELYTDQMRDRVGEVFARDVEEFGYQF